MSIFQRAKEILAPRNIDLTLEQNDRVSTHKDSPSGISIENTNQSKSSDESS